MKPEWALMVDSLLLTNGRSGFLEGTLGLAGNGFFDSVLESLFSMLKMETIEGRLGRIYVMGVATSIGEEVTSHTSKTSISSRSAGSIADSIAGDSKIFEYLSKEKSEGLLKDGASMGRGDEAVFSLGMLGAINWRDGASNKTPFAALCFLISETMTGIPLGVVTLMSDSVSTEVEALISGEELGEEAAVSLIAIAAFILLDVPGCGGALCMDS